MKFWYYTNLLVLLSTPKCIPRFKSLLFILQFLQVFLCVLSDLCGENIVFTENENYPGFWVFARNDGSLPQDSASLCVPSRTLR